MAVRRRFPQSLSRDLCERIWANAWDVFRRMPSRGGRGRRAAAVDFLVCFRCGGFFRALFFHFFSFERRRPTASMGPPCLIYLSTSNEEQTSERSDALHTTNAEPISTVVTSVCGGPLFCPPSTSALVQNHFEFVELGGDICSN